MPFEKVKSCCAFLAQVAERCVLAIELKAKRRAWQKHTNSVRVYSLRFFDKTLKESHLINRCFGPPTFLLQDVPDFFAYGWEEFFLFCDIENAMRESLWSPRLASKLQFYVRGRERNEPVLSS